MKTFRITFTDSPESGIYSANLIKADSAEQATAYFQTLGNYEIVGCTETNEEPKPGQPVHTVPEGWKAPEEEATATKNEYTLQAENFLTRANAKIKIEFQGLAVNTNPKNLYATTKEEAAKIYNRFPAADNITYAGRFTDDNAKTLLSYTSVVLHPGVIV